MVLKDPDIIGETFTLWMPADDKVDMLIKGHVRRDLQERDRLINDKQLSWIDTLEKEGKVKKKFNRAFFTAGDSREPELAGIWGAMVGSFLTPDRHPIALVSHRCCSGHLPGRICAKQSVDGCHRG